MRAWVWLAMAGCGRLGFDPSAAGDAMPPDVVTTFPGARPDPTQLPMASGQVEPPIPPGAGLAAGDSYTDPSSGVRIWRLTDATFPAPNTSARIERAGGSQVSAAWDDTHHTIAVAMQDNGTIYLIDLERGVGIGNARRLAVQGGEDTIAFTTDPQNPRLVYAGGGDGLHRVDSATNTVIDVPPFPVGDLYTLPTVSAGGRVVVAQTYSRGYFAIDTIAGTVDTIVTGTDAVPVLDHDGGFITQLVSGPSQLWKIGEATTSPWLPPSGDFQESTGVAGGFLAIDIDNGGAMPIYLSNPATGMHQRLGEYGTYDAVQFASQWIQTDVELRDQWVLLSTIETEFPPGRIDDALGLFRLDGDLRFLTHHHAPDDPSYYLSPRPSMSPDGRIVVFASNMGTGRNDVYAVEVPLTP